MSFPTDIVVLSNLPKFVAEGVEVVVVPRRRLPWRLRGTFDGPRSWRVLRQEYEDWRRHLDLPFAHKQIFADRLNDYDLFVYSEDDTLLTERHLRAFLSVSAVLAEDEIPGFLRYELGPNGRVNYPEVHGHFHWKVSSVRKRGGYTLAYFTNEHAACFAVTREQLRRAIASGGFLVPPHGGKYDLLCTAATDIYTQCGFQKLICISQLDDFLIHHMPNKYVGTEFGVDDHELRRQVRRLSQIAQNGTSRWALLEAETRLMDRRYSKAYYEPVRPEVMSGIPGNARSVLSIGSGWGAIERALAARGLNVVAIPLDSVMSDAAEGKGIEMIDGDFEHAQRKLEGRQFDCVFISNVLHLVREPLRMLSASAELLTPGGTLLAVIPNTSRLKLTRSGSRDSGGAGSEMFERDGIQCTSQDLIRRWFGASGLRINSLQPVLGPRARKWGRLASGLMDSWLAFEFLVTATKNSQSGRSAGVEMMDRTGTRV